jgi:DNA repair protein RadD
MDSYMLVESACREIAELTENRNKVLIFTSGVEHGRHVASAIQRLSRRECGFVFGNTPGLERESLIERFKHGDLKFLANVNVLTTGFNATNIDCVVLLRPTNSPGLYYQMVGRGFRLHPGKDDCLVLDYGGNILRHGPVDDLQIKQPGQSKGEAPARECPKCQSVIHAAVLTCPDCGYEFPPPERETHQAVATNSGILSGQITDEVFEVKDVMYHVHRKRGGDVDTPTTLRVEYETPGYVWKKEWVCPEHTGYARAKFEAWWRKRSHEPPPDNVEQAIELAEAGALARPVSITVRTVAGEKFDRIIGCELGEIPPRLDGSDERECEGPISIIEDEEIPF